MPKCVLDHTSVRIADLPRSREFYEKILGFRPALRPELGIPGVWYDLGVGQLHLIQRDGSAARRGGAIDPTDPHFAVQVEDLDAMRRQLKEAGIEILDFGADQLWVHDPDGNTVELRSPGARP